MMLEILLNFFSLMTIVGIKTGFLFLHLLYVHSLVLIEA